MPSENPSNAMLHWSVQLQDTSRIRCSWVLPDTYVPCGSGSPEFGRIFGAKRRVRRGKKAVFDVHGFDGWILCLVNMSLAVVFLW